MAPRDSDGWHMHVEIPARFRAAELTIEQWQQIVDILAGKPAPQPDWGPNLVDCPHCNGAAMSRAALDQHIKIHHPEFHKEKEQENERPG